MIVVQTGFEVVNAEAASREGFVRTQLAMRGHVGLYPFDYHFDQRYPRWITEQTSEVVRNEAPPRRARNWGANVQAPKTSGRVCSRQPCSTWTMRRMSRRTRIEGRDVNRTAPLHERYVRSLCRAVAGPGTEVCSQALLEDSTGTLRDHVSRLTAYERFDVVHELVRQ